MEDGRIVRVADLRDQMEIQGPRPFLYCAVCGAEHSAHRGDYFMLPARHVFACCDEPMRLVTARRLLVEVTP